MNEKVESTTEQPTPRKFYHALNCNRRIGGVLFKVYGHISGTWCGTYSTENPAEIAVLDELSKTGAVESISEEQHDSYVKKKPTVSENYSPLANSQASLTVDQHQLVPRPGVQLVENPSSEVSPKIAPTSEPLGSVDEALSIGAVSDKTGEPDKTNA